MARSARIYLATLPNVGVVAAFTVRHELVTWLSNQEHRQEHKLYVIPDGGRGRPEEKNQGFRPFALHRDLE